MPYNPAADAYSDAYSEQHRTSYHAGADCDGTCIATGGTVSDRGAIIGAVRERYTDSLGYPVALGYDDEPEPDLRARAQRVLVTPLAEPDDFTGPDLDLDAVIAGANDATRGGAIRHDYLAALRERGAIRATNHRGTGDTNHAVSDAQHAARYLDDEPGDPFYD